MSESFDIVSFAVALAVNLVLFGIVAAVGMAAAFRLGRIAPPRARYLVAVAAFSLASVAPFIITLHGASKSDSIPAVVEPNRTFEANLQETFVVTEKSSQDLLAVSAMKKRFAASLDGFVLYVSDGWSAKMFFAVWMFISVLLLWREFISHRRLALMRKNLQPASVSLREDLLCPDDVRLYISELETPATVGLLRPVVIFPARLPADFSRATARSILRHEIAHACWRDPLVNASLRIVRAAFWISPALWFIERVIRDEREAAADCSALANPGSGNDEAAIDYAASLVVVAKLSRQFSRRKLLGAATQFGGSTQLEKRIRRLLAGYAKTSPARLSLAAIIILFSFLGVLLLPVASQPLSPHRHLLTDDKPDDIFPRNNSAEQNSSADFERKIEDNVNGKDWKNPSSVAVYKLNSGSLSDDVESRIRLSVQPTPLVNSEKEPDKARRENENNESNDDVILPVPAREAVKPIPAVPPFPATPAELPLLPQTPEVPKLKPLPEIPKLKPVPELPKLKFVVE